MIKATRFHVSIFNRMARQFKRVNAKHLYEIRRRKDHRGFDLINAIPARFTAHGAV
jgi:hypothetical protein